MDLGLEQAVRDAAFEFVRSIVDADGVVAWADLRRFTFRGEQVHLSGQQGIFKPRQLDLPISIRTAPPQDGRVPPYPDRMGDDDRLHYAYRGTDPQFHENVRLRAVRDAGLPLLYLHGVDRGRYLVSVAVITDDRMADLTFEMALADIAMAAPGFNADQLGASQRTHQLVMVKQRVNQASFRHRVMRAYMSCCALCRLKHVELLDAAHIRPYADGGASVVPNGLALCKIHHAAFDAGILGIRPDLVAEIREDVMREVDGPMLAHGLQALDGAKLRQPRSTLMRPDPDALEFRYEQFRRAG